MSIQFWDLPQKWIQCSCHAPYKPSLWKANTEARKSTWRSRSWSCTLSVQISWEMSLHLTLSRGMLPSREEGGMNSARSLDILSCLWFLLLCCWSSRDPRRLRSGSRCWTSPLVSTAWHCGSQHWTAPAWDWVELVTQEEQRWWKVVEAGRKDDGEAVGMGSERGRTLGPGWGHCQGNVHQFIWNRSHVFI